MISHILRGLASNTFQEVLFGQGSPMTNRRYHGTDGSKFIARSHQPEQIHRRQLGQVRVVRTAFQLTEVRRNYLCPVPYVWGFVLGPGP